MLGLCLLNSETTSQDGQINSAKEIILGGTWVAQSVKQLPSTQVMIPGSWDRVLHWAPCREPASPSAYVSASLCVSHEEIKIKSLKIIK